jgi:hypothetical protein
VTNRDRLVFLGLVVERDAPRRPDFILSAIAFSDRTRIIVFDHKTRLAKLHRKVRGEISKAIFFHERKHGHLVRSHVSWEFQHHTSVAFFDYFFIIYTYKKCQKCSVNTLRRFNDMRKKFAFVVIGISEFERLFGIILVLG